MNKVYLGLITVLACACICVGQANKTGGDVSLMSGARIDAELQKTIDVNNARVGDAVVMKTTKTIKNQGEVLIPKGTTLIGRITEIQRRTKENGRSRIGMIFERIQGKDLSAPFSASIVSITNAAASLSAGDPLMSDVSGSSQTSATASRGDSGGLLGGVGNTVGGLVNTTTQTVGTVTNTAGQSVGSTTGMVERTVNGIQISGSASGSANSSTTLSSANKNLRVEKGATFNLVVTGRTAAQE